MTLRTFLLAAPAVLLLAGCDEMMAPTAGGDIRDAGAIAPETTATTPAGTVAAQLAAPGDAAECQRLALVIEDGNANAVDRQAALDQREQLGCPAIAAIN